ncbi:MAG: TetR/AcrR family transcriptional regulator [Candidatus Marinimicrobia bacterium]|nr:TetR/AcrR family transcriptional regulator [Candidatus Neomarinimicrobiota bacterium]
MVKSFDSQEREKIRLDILNKGRELFEIYGLKKTSVEDIAIGVGISKGSFYNFFVSKEELFYLIIEEEEHFRDQILTDLIANEPSAEKALRQLFGQALKYIDSSTMLEKLYEPGVFQQLLRKLPTEKLAAHQANDHQATRTFIDHFQQHSNLRQVEPEVLSAFFRAIFLITLHKKEVGAELYPKVMELLVEVIASGLTEPRESRND